MQFRFVSVRFFFFNDTATTEIYTLSLHDALPICRLPHVDADRVVRVDLALERDGDAGEAARVLVRVLVRERLRGRRGVDRKSTRLNSKSRQYLVCRLLLEKKKTEQDRLRNALHSI